MTGHEQVARPVLSSRRRPRVRVRRVRGDERPGVPFSSTASTKVALSAGISRSPFTMAKAMRCVKETFAPLERASDSLSAARLISSRRAGTVRTLVAVGRRDWPPCWRRCARRRRAAVSPRRRCSRLASTVGARGRATSRRRHRGALIVGEELAPTLGDRVGIGQESVVHVVDQPRVGPKRALCSSETTMIRGA